MPSPTKKWPRDLSRLGRLELAVALLAKDARRFNVYPSILQPAGVSTFYKRITSDALFTANSFTTTGLTLALKANTNYVFAAEIGEIFSLTTTSANFQIHSLAAGTSLVIAVGSESASGATGWATATGTSILASNAQPGILNDKGMTSLSGTITVGSTATTLQIDAANPAGLGTFTVKAGSWVWAAPVS